MADIGERAFQAICERAERNGTWKNDEADKMGISRWVINGWKRCKSDPTAYFLKQMALAGYDVMHILTGGESHSADVVCVVRCKDCKHLNVLNRDEIYAYCPKVNTVFRPFGIDTRVHFCSYGERMANETY